VMCFGSFTHRLGRGTAVGVGENTARCEGSCGILDDFLVLQMFHLFQQLHQNQVLAAINDAGTCNEQGLSPNSPMDSNTQPGAESSPTGSC